MSDLNDDAAGDAAIPLHPDFSRPPTATPTAGPGGTSGPGPAPAPAARRRRWPAVLGVVVVVVLLAGFIAARINVDYYVITPGSATPVSQYIEVPPHLDHPLTGKILLTDVYVSQLNALSYLRYHVFDSNSEIFPGSELFQGAPTEGQYLNQGYLQMAQAQSYATAAALTRLGYHVSFTNVGAIVYGVPANSPSSGVLQVAQVITALGATPTPTDCSLTRALHGLQPGTKAALTVEDSSINSQGDFVGGPVVHKTVTLGRPPKGLVDTGCGPAVKPTAYLGVLTQTQQDWHFPVHVTIHTTDIGGPSAGLAMTLGIIDRLSSGRLTGHRVVAATGTMDQYGNVGDVGGVAEKTVAVENAGATVFFVPPQELGAAESKATPQLHVYAVRNLDQVLRILQRLGGSVPPRTPVPAQAAP
jgi:PDZ domain-containing protein